MREEERERAFAKKALSEKKAESSFNLPRGWSSPSRNRIRSTRFGKKREMGEKEGTIIIGATFRSDRLDVTQLEAKLQVEVKI